MTQKEEIIIFGILKMRLVDIEKLQRENELLKLRLKESHEWIKHMGDWDKFLIKSMYEKQEKNNV